MRIERRRYRIRRPLLENIRAVHGHTAWFAGNGKGLKIFYISFGIISYVLINLLTGHRDRFSLLMYVLAVLLVCKYIFL